jgi:betaine-aldehyde dehydrogenase
VLVHNSVKATFMEKLLARLPGVRIGDSLSSEFEGYSGAQMGPLVNKIQYDKVWAFIDGAKADNCQFAYGGERSMVAGVNGGKGFFVPPCVILDPPMTCTVWKEEIFGPVVCIRGFDTEEEAIRISNDSPYGLAGAVFSADEGKCERVARAMRVGIVWKNNCQPAFVVAPWGGCKLSGFGRDLGRCAVDGCDLQEAYRWIFANVLCLLIFRCCFCCCCCCAMYL